MTDFELFQKEFKKWQHFIRLKSEKESHPGLPGSSLLASKENTFDKQEGF